MPACSCDGVPSDELVPTSDAPAMSGPALRLSQQLLEVVVVDHDQH
jgi:hypothetical protein